MYENICDLGEEGRRMRISGIKRTVRSQLKQAAQGTRVERRETSLHTRAEQRERAATGQSEGITWGADDVVSSGPRHFQRCVCGS